MDSHVIVGRICNIKEIHGQKTEEKDNRVLNFSVAVQRYSKGKGRDQEGNPTDYVTTFHNCKAFGATAGRISDKFEKGKFIVVIGSDIDEKYTPKDSEEERTSRVLVVNQIEGPFALANGTSSENTQETAKPASKPASATRPASANKPAPAAKKAASTIDDDIPF